MKTSFHSDEDIATLFRILGLGIMHTDQWLDPLMHERCPEYGQLMLKVREKCFEWRGEQDPNQMLVDEILKLTLSKTIP